MCSGNESINKGRLKCPYSERIHFSLVAVLVVLMKNYDFVSFRSSRI